MLLSRYIPRFQDLMFPKWLTGKDSAYPMQETQETWVPSPHREDLLEKEMITHPSIFAWKIPWAEDSGELQSMGSQELDMTEPHNVTQTLTRWGPV